MAPSRSSRPTAELLASVGDPDQFIYLRSSAKPFQLAPFVASGRFDEYRLGTEALAIMAASHSGEDRHVRLVQEILRGAGLTSAVLQNQVHAPLDTGDGAAARAGRRGADRAAGQLLWEARRDGPVREGFRLADRDATGTPTTRFSSLALQTISAPSPTCRSRRS